MDRFLELERPLVYGYLCIEQPNEPQVTAWSREIAAFCTTSGYRLGSVFVDRGIATGSFTRGGFIELLAALRLPTAYAVVVPSLAQLSAETCVQQVLVHTVQLTNSQLLVCGGFDGADPALDRASELGAGA